MRGEEEGGDFFLVSNPLLRRLIKEGGFPTAAASLIAKRRTQVTMMHHRVRSQLMFNRCTLTEMIN